MTIANLNWFLIIISIFTLINGPVETKSSQQYRDLRLKKIFNRFLKQNSREYLQNFAEYQFRFDIFKKSLYKINSLNQKRQHHKSALYGLTPFADITESEFDNAYLTKSEQIEKLSQLRIDNRRRLASNTNHTFFAYKPTFSLAPKIDWRNKGIISPVHYQGVCGACWAISVIETIESLKALQTNSSVIELSVQQMIDCAKNHNLGCVGGDTCKLLEWLTSEHIGIERRSAYPDRGEDEEHMCKNVSSPMDSLTFVKSFSCENLAGQEDKLLYYLNSGPVTVALSALNWQFYVGGVIQFHCDASYSSRNHAVQIVGYDLTAEIPHYILRNSWGLRFGDAGYVKIAIGQNICGIANQVSRISVE